MIELLIIALATLAGVTSQRVVGFGIAAFLSPIALLFFEPSRAVIITLLAGTLSCIIILFSSRGGSTVIWQVVFRLFAASIPGLLLGAYVVTRIDKGLLQIVLGMVIIAGILIQEHGFAKPTKALGVTRGISIGGFFSGFLNAAAANGAPALVLWLRMHTSTPEQIRQNLAALFVIMNVCSMLAIHSMKPQSFNGEVGLTFMALVPVIVCASVLGGRLAKKVNGKLFEKLVVATIIITGLVTIGLGISSKI